MGDFIPQPPSLGTGAGCAQWAQKPGGASGIARGDTCGATMRVPRFSPKPPSSLRAYSLFLFESSISLAFTVFPTHKLNCKFLCTK